MVLSASTVMVLSHKDLIIRRWRFVVYDVGVISNVVIVWHIGIALFIFVGILRTSTGLVVQMTVMRMAVIMMVMMITSTIRIPAMSIMGMVIGDIVGIVFQRIHARSR